jgi:hypothetical protein
LSEHFRPWLAENWHPLAEELTEDHGKRLLRIDGEHGDGLVVDQDERALWKEGHRI